MLSIASEIEKQEAAYVDVYLQRDLPKNLGIYEKLSRF